MLHALPSTGTIKEGTMISRWRRIWSIIVGTRILICVSLMLLLFTLTMLLHITLNTKILLVYSSVIWINRWLITMWILVRPVHHQIEPVETHCLSLTGHVWNHISSIHAKKEDRCIICQVKTTWMCCTLMPIPEENFSLSCWWQPSVANIELPLIVLLYYI